MVNIYCPSSTMYWPFLKLKLAILHYNLKYSIYINYFKSMRVIYRLQLMLLLRWERCLQQEVNFFGEDTVESKIVEYIEAATLWAR